MTKSKNMTPCFGRSTRCRRDICLVDHPRSGCNDTVEGLTVQLYKPLVKSIVKEEWLWFSAFHAILSGSGDEMKWI